MSRIDLSALAAISDEAQSHELRERLKLRFDSFPSVYLVGHFGSASFVATQDADGKTEVSLCDFEKRLSGAVIRAFFRKIGQPIPDAPPTKINKGRGLHWVLHPGVAQ